MPEARPAPVPGVLSEMDMEWIETGTTLDYVLEKTLVTRVTISENFALHAAVQELVDVKPD